jgi:uncharacterized phage protein gp47/JayE
MVARAVGRSRLLGLFRNSIVTHLLAAASTEDAEQYFQMARLRQTFSLDRCTGTDLDERAAEIVPNIVQRDAAQFASTLAVFSRPTTVGVTAIPQGTVVGARDSAGVIRYRTIAPTTIPDTVSVSTPVTVVAEQRGARANVDAGQITLLLSKPPGVTGVTNPTAVTNGRNRESDPSFIAKKKAFVQAIARGTPTAIRTFALSVTLSDGRAVRFAQLHEPSPPTGRIFLYIDDGTGQLDSPANRAFVGADIVVASADGSERKLFTTELPIDEALSYSVTLTRGGSPTVLTRNVHYSLAPPRGQINILTSALFPSGTLQAGDQIVASYTHFTGLVQQVQRVENGNPQDRLNFPGVVTGGVDCYVLPAKVDEQYFTASLVVLQGYEATAVIAEAKQAAIAYINSLDPAENVILAQIGEDVMRVEGVYNFKLTSYKGSSFLVDQIISDGFVARVVDSTKVVFT